MAHVLDSAVLDNQLKIHYNQTLKYHPLYQQKETVSSSLSRNLQFHQSFLFSGSWSRDLNVL